MSFSQFTDYTINILSRCRVRVEEVLTLESGTNDGIMLNSNYTLLRLLSSLVLTAPPIIRAVFSFHVFSFKLGACCGGGGESEARLIQIQH